MITKVQQGDIFGSKQEKPVKVPEVKSAAPRVNISLLSGLDRENCTKEAVMMLRMLQKRFLSRGQDVALIKAIYAEAEIKSGKRPPHLIMQELFLQTMLAR